MKFISRKFCFVFFLGLGLSYASFRLVQGAELLPSFDRHGSFESVKGHDDSQKQADSSVAPASIPDAGRGQHASENSTPAGEFVSPHSGSTSGTVLIDFRVQEASAVEFFLEQPGLNTPLYIGQGVASPSNDWTFSWDTVNTPNGSYKLFGKITHGQGSYESQRVTVIVQNKVVELEQKIAQAQQKIAEVDKHVEDITKQTTQDLTQTIASPSAAQSPSLIVTLPVPAAVQKKLDQQVQDFAASVQQSNDIAQKIARQQAKQETLDQKIQTEQKAIQDAEVKHLDVVVPEKQKVIESLQNEKEATQKEIRNNQQSLQAVQQTMVQKKEDVTKEVVATVQQSQGIEKPVASNVQADVSQKMDTLATNISSVQPEKQQAQSVLSVVSSSSGVPSPASSTSTSTPPSTQQNAPAVTPGAYQDPHSIAPLHADEYSVDHVALVKKPNSTQSVLDLEGKGAPDTFVIVTVFSNPLVFTTKTDSTGRWHYTLDVQLPEGTHEVFVTVTNKQGALTARSEGFFFAKTANAVAAISEGLGQEQSSEFVSSLQGQSMVFIFVIIGLGVILGLGLVGMTQRKNV